MVYAKLGGYKKGNNKIFKVIDTACINGKGRAEKEAKNGEYTYFYGAGFNLSDNEMEFLKKAFLKKDIKIDYYFVSCMGEPINDKFSYNCYEDAANTEFEKKYGKSRIDSMKKAYYSLREEAFKLRYK